MQKLSSIDLKDYNYDLPKERIAQYPLPERDGSKLLLYRNGDISEDIFNAIHQHLPAESLLIFNDTRVIRARLLFRRETGSTIEIFCLEPREPADYALTFGSREAVVWKCLVGNRKKWKNGILSTGFFHMDRKYNLYAESVNGGTGTNYVRFSWDAGELTFGEVLEACGHIPLPPYINREDEADDSSRYQTIYSAVRGSVAAPTAGLHFTKRVFNSLAKKGISWANLTLHVGAGTFQPVKTDDISKHEMHTEHFIVSEHFIETVARNTGKIVAVGTTSVRTLESLYWLGVKLAGKPGTKAEELFIGQWEPYFLEDKISSLESLDSLLMWMKKQNLKLISIPTGIIIVPGYRFRLTDGIITNFHQPGSTLLLLVSAWTGDDWKKIYDYALGNGFRFLSYGDSSLLLR